VNNTQYSTCLRAAFGHYLFCHPWEQPLSSSSRTSNTTSCQNPFFALKDLTVKLIIYLKSLGPKYSKEVATLERLEQNVEALDSCNDSQTVYQETKQDLCWDVSNSMMQVTLLCILQSPILIVLLIYVLFGWHRFYLQNLPIVGSAFIFSKYSDDPKSDEQLLIEDAGPDKHTEELGILGDLSEDDTPTKSYDTMYFDTNLYPSSGPSTTSSHGMVTAMYEEYKKIELKLQIKKIMVREVHTIGFTAGLLLIVFLTIFVWLGIVNNNFGVHSDHC